ncbi:MAG: tRNA 2-thiouridine(34) synthase MnmA [Deltaproteobacteria bacterium]|nr:tRNA 2-thiouridine(34) synthase MnmA [Deltaproteobacteria bacterium]
MSHYPPQKKIAVALSGGIDSAVAAALLKEEGYDIFALHMLIPTDGMAVCAEKAEVVARRLNIPFYTVDVEKPFTEEVIHYFIDEYLQGRTPNPCVVCNKQIKLGVLLERALSLGAEKMATGHYARVTYNEESGRFSLRKGSDRAKDQSYFLSTLRQEQLARILLPLGEKFKTEVKAYASRIGLKDLSEPESQDVCFIPHGDYKEFLRERIPPDLTNSGDIVDTKGRILGKHQGIFSFTIGQRRGLGLPDTTPFYVLGFNVEKKQVIIGKKEDLYRQDCIVEKVTWVSIREITQALEVKTRIRYKHREAPAILTPVDAATVRVRFLEPQKAITPGQVAVFYKGDVVVGGGFIA